MIQSRLVIKQILLFLLLILMLQLTIADNRFPQILTESYNQTFNVSSTAILTCHVRDLGEHHVTWLKIDPYTSMSSPLAVGTQLFIIDKRYSISFYSTSPRESIWLLEIYQLNLSDEGTYVCKITNRKASASVSIHLYLQIPMSIHPTYIYAEPNMSIKLNCSILIDSNHNNHSENLYYKSNISWHFSSNQLNKKKLPDVNIRKKLSKDTFSSFIIINHTQTYHTGVWTCAYRHQRVSAKIIVEKGILRHQRASALLSNDFNRRSFSINLFLFVLFIVLYTWKN